MGVKRVFKYELSITSIAEVQIPAGARVLSVGGQQDANDNSRERLFLWALVDEYAREETRSFVVLGTGHEVANGEAARYVGTAHLYSGAFVLHVFEIPPS